MKTTRQAANTAAGKGYKMNATVTSLPTTNRKTSRRKSRKAKSGPVNKLSLRTRKVFTYATAALTPCMGATFAHFAAELGVAGNMLAIVPAIIAAAVLFVSLPHVADGLKEVTGQSLGNCRALAVGIDAGLIALKAGLMLGTLGATWLLWGGLVVLLTMSGAMNLVAYSK